MSIRLSPDHKKIYVTTIDHNGIEVIDVATRKVINHFVLNTPTKQYRLFNGTPDPEGKFFYAVTKEITKFPEHYEVAKPKYTVIDLEQQKIVKTVDITKEEEAQNQGDYGVGWLEISPDGKYLYQFGEKITILQASDFKVVDHIDLARPDAPGMENVHFGGDLDLINEPGEHTGMFVSVRPDRSQPRVRFGAFRSDHPADGLQADRTRSGRHGGHRGHAGQEVGLHGGCQLESTGTSAASSGRSISPATESRKGPRFLAARASRFGISADGKKLYIYGAGFDIEVYDAATLKYEKTWDLNNDVTYAGIVVIP